MARLVGVKSMLVGRVGRSLVKAGGGAGTEQKPYI